MFLDDSAQTSDVAQAPYSEGVVMGVIIRLSEVINRHLRNGDLDPFAGGQGHQAQHARQLHEAGF